jgi:hypothetical protein
MEKITDSNGKDMFIYTEEQLMARLKFFIGICLALTLTGIVFVVLYSLIFVTQPMNAISPVDQKFFELIIPIATFLTGTLSGIMLAGGDKDLKAKALEAANREVKISAAPPPTQEPYLNLSPANDAPAFKTPVSSTVAPDAMFTAAVPTAFTPAPAAKPTAPPMSSTGKPMPVQPDEPEL